MFSCDNNAMNEANQNRTVFRVPRDGFNENLEIIATENGLEIDDVFIIPWDWITSRLALIRPRSSGLTQQAFSALSQEVP